MTMACETAFQIALRNFSKEEQGKVNIHVIWVKGKYMQQAHIFCRRLLLVTRSRHHNEGFQCFSRYEEIQELSSY